MVEPSLKSSFLARQPFSKSCAPAARASRAFNSFLLETFSQICVVAQLIYCVGIPVVPLTRISDKLSTQIDTRAFVRVDNFRWLWLNLDLNVILPRLSFNQCGRGWCFSTQQMLLVITNQQWERISPIFQRQLNCPVVFVKAKYSGIVSGTSRFKLLNWTVLKFRCFAIARNSENCLTDHVGWQLKCLFTVMVSFFMDSQSTCNFWVNCKVNSVTTISETLKCGINFLCHFRFNPKLATDRTHLFYHVYSPFHIGNRSQSIRGKDLVLSCLSRKSASRSGASLLGGRR